MKINSSLLLTTLSIGHLLMSEGHTTMVTSTSIYLKYANWTAAPPLAYSVNDNYYHREETHVNDPNIITSIHNTKNIPSGKRGILFSITVNDSILVIHQQQASNSLSAGGDTTRSTMVGADVDHYEKTTSEEQSDESIPTMGNEPHLKYQDFLLFYLFLFVGALALFKLDKECRREEVEFDNLKPTASEQISRQS